MHRNRPFAFFLSFCLFAMGILPLVSVDSSVSADDADSPVPTAKDAHVWFQMESSPALQRTIYTWDFQTPDSPAFSGWVAAPACTYSQGDGCLQITSTNDDPYVFCGVNLPEAARAMFPTKLVAKVTARGNTRGNMQAYWSIPGAPGFTEARVARSRSMLTEEWQTIEIPFESNEPITGFRLDPAAMPGSIQIQKIEICAVTEVLDVELLPSEPLRQRMELEQNPAPIPATFSAQPQTAQLRVTNRLDEPVSFQINGESIQLAAKEARVFTGTSDPRRLYSTFTWTIHAEQLPVITRTVSFVHDAEITDDWRVLKTRDFDFCIAPDSSVAFLRVGDRKVAAVAPLLSEEQLQIQPTSDGTGIEFRALRDVEAPILRIPGEMQYAVLPGLELLEKGEWSSSKLDLLTPEFDRTRPAYQLLTQQWMGMVTENAIVRLQWSTPTLQPTFSIPNRFDTTPDARFSLEMKAGETARLYASSATGTNADAMRLNLEGTTEQMKLHHRISQQPAPSKETLWKWYAEAMLRENLYVENVGWRHCAAERWRAYPISGIASSLWLVGSEVPDFHPFSDGGSHIENDKIYFLRGQADVKRGNWIRRAGWALNSQREDGSFTYSGKYLAGHFENTALGVCAISVNSLLNGYLASNEPAYLEAAVKALRYMRRFHVARGAQCWEMPLHTPDPLAAAYAIRAYTLAYRITKEPEFLEEARRWALEGLTCVYWWDEPDKPLQFGATIGVLGSTNWQAPFWIGRPVQWIGTVYAYGLLEFADVLKELDGEEAQAEAAKWRDVALKITESAERQTYPEGEYRGLLPDSFDVFSEARFPWNINPSAMVSLRTRLDGGQDGVVFFWNDKHRVASPFPAKLTEMGVDFTAPANVPFQILLDGEVVDVPASENPHVEFPAKP